MKKKNDNTNNFKKINNKRNYQEILPTWTCFILLYFYIQSIKNLHFQIFQAGEFLI